MFKNLIKWSKPQYKDLPWRKKRTLYRTLVSEIMLQQTTVGTVLGKFEDFLKTFPTLKALAKASDDEVTIAWKGLGYYRRARNLKAAANIIQKDFKGIIPKSYDDLISIKGIGPYTAQALLSIGMDKPGLAVDANLERVFSRLYMIEEFKGPHLQREVQSFMENKDFLKKLTGTSYRDLNEAFMDLGRVVCISKKPRCLLCPIKNKCQAFQHDRVLDFPLVKEKKKDFHELSLLRVLVQKKNEVLVYKKGKTEWLSGQYELPSFVISTDDKEFKQYPKWKGSTQGFKKLPMIKSGITKYKIQNYILSMKPQEFTRYKKMFSDISYKEAVNPRGNFSTNTLKVLKKFC